MTTELPTILYQDDGQEREVYKLPPAERDNLDSVLVFAMPKSGSVLLDRMMRELSAHVGLTYVSIMEEFFNLGIPDNLFPPSTSAIFRPKGYCYGGFRYYPRKFDIPIVGEVKKILLIRDPRDMLVSHYFSMLKSHPARGTKLASSESRMKSRELAGELEINAYVRRMAKRFNIFLQHYKTLCENEEVRVYRYEDVIYKKKEWIDDFTAYFGWQVDDEIKDEIAKKNDIIPSQEDDAQHVRQVHPGNYKNKLEADTIQELTAYFREEMKFFGYDPSL